jgi:hypothetical protein
MSQMLVAFGVGGAGGSWAKLEEGHPTKAIQARDEAATKQRMEVLTELIPTTVTATARRRSTKNMRYAPLTSGTALFSFVD